MARAGNMYHRVKFYLKLITRDEYGSSSDSWSGCTIQTRGEVRYIGGNKTLSADERFYSKSMELTIRWRSDIEDTMRVQIDDESTMYEIVYKEEVGRHEALRLTLEKVNV